MIKKNGQAFVLGSVRGPRERYWTPVLLALPFWWEKQIYVTNKIKLGVEIQVLPEAREEM